MPLRDLNINIPRFKIKIANHRIDATLYLQRRDGGCCDSDIYFDAVLSRILEVRQASGLVDVPDDWDWTTLIDVILVPNPFLRKRMQDVVKRDYSMTRGRRVFKIRKALLFYFINTLPGDFRRSPNKKNPREQEVVIVNHAEVGEALKS